MCKKKKRTSSAPTFPTNHTSVEVAQAPKFCTGCGAALAGDNDRKFCGYCGTARAPPPVFAAAGTELVEAPAAPAASAKPYAKIKELEELLDAGALTQEEFDSEKKKILAVVAPAASVTMEMESDDEDVHKI